MSPYLGKRTILRDFFFLLMLPFRFTALFLLMSATPDNCNHAYVKIEFVTLPVSLTLSVYLDTVTSINDVINEKFSMYQAIVFTTVVTALEYFVGGKLLALVAA